MSRINSINKFLIAQTFSYIYFWIAISIPYLNYRGFTLEEALGLISLYTISIAILEYPTGAIADYYGHKMSLMCGHIIMGIGILVMSFDLPFSYLYYFAAIIMATGSALTSGSDIALLKGISENFKRDMPNYKSLSNFVVFVTAFASGFLAKADIRLPLFLTFIFSLLAGLIVFTIKTEPHTRLSGNVYKNAFLGIKTIFTDKILLVSITFSLAIGGYIAGVKSLLGTFNDIFNLNVQYVGIIVGLSMLTRAIGAKLFHKFDGIRTYHLTLIAIALTLLSAYSKNVLVPALFIIIANFFIILIDLRMDLVITDLAHANYRASVLSFTNLLTRAFTSVYLLFAGFMIKQINFAFLMLSTAFLFLIILLVYEAMNNRLQSRYK